MNLLDVLPHPAFKPGAAIMYGIDYRPNNCWGSVTKVWASTPTQCTNPDPGDDLGLCASCRATTLPSEETT